jgi:hypothetical protein
MDLTAVSILGLDQYTGKSVFIDFPFFNTVRLSGFSYTDTKGDNLIKCVTYKHDDFTLKLSS